MTISEYLKFDVAWLFNVLFDDDMLVAKALKCLTLGSVQLIEKLLLVPDNTHALATASQRGLDDDGEANLFGLAQQELRLLPVSVISWHDRHISVSHDKFGLALRSHRMNRFGGRADENLK